MIEEASAVLPLWMLLSAAFGFLVGEACGDSFRRRKCLEQANQKLGDELENAPANQEHLLRELKRQRGEINDIHKHVVAVTKALEKRPS
jgi:hypothetical protein